MKIESDIKNQKIDNNIIRFIDVDEKWHEELSRALTSIEVGVKNNKMTYKVNFEYNSYPISKETYDTFKNNFERLIN